MSWQRKGACFCQLILSSAVVCIYIFYSSLITQLQQTVLISGILTAFQSSCSCLGLSQHCSGTGRNLRSDIKRVQWKSGQIIGTPVKTFPCTKIAGFGFCLLVVLACCHFGAVSGWFVLGCVLWGFLFSFFLTVFFV